MLPGKTLSGNKFPSWGSDMDYTYRVHLLVRVGDSRMSIAVDVYTWEALSTEEVNALGKLFPEAEFMYAELVQS